MLLVGLYTYCEMMHGAYNVKKFVVLHTAFNVNTLEVDSVHFKFDCLYVFGSEFMFWECYFPFFIV